MVSFIVNAYTVWLGNNQSRCYIVQYQCYNENNMRPCKKPSQPVEDGVKYVHLSNPFQVASFTTWVKQRHNSVTDYWIVPIPRWIYLYYYHWINKKLTDPTGGTITVVVDNTDMGITDSVPPKSSASFLCHYRHVGLLQNIG